MPRRYEREIMELLERNERENRGRERVQRVRRNVDQARGRVAPTGAWGAWEKLGGLRWTVASILLALLAFVLHTAVPPVLTNIGIIVAVGVFLAPVFVRPPHTMGSDEPTWRGQRIEPTPFPIRPTHPGPFARLRRFFEDVRRGRHR